MLASLHNRYVLVLFHVSSNSIYCIVVSSLLFSPSIYKSCFVICLQLPAPRLVYKLFAGGKVMKLVIFQFFNKICCCCCCCWFVSSRHEKEADHRDTTIFSPTTTTWNLNLLHTAWTLQNCNTVLWNKNYCNTAPKITQYRKPLHPPSIWLFTFSFFPFNV